MIRTKNIVTDLSDVDVAWAFEWYLKLDEKLIGQEVKITSPLNADEKVPSFTLFYDKNNYYLYKCFSTGHSGDVFDLVKHMFHLKSKAEAFRKVMSDYSQYLKNNNIEINREYKRIAKFKVTDYKIRNWNIHDKNYWTSFHIGNKILEAYNIAALESFTMSKNDDFGEKTIVIKRDLIYGYFTKTGNLYKIYQPGNKDCKFIKVLDYIQGNDQLTGECDNLLITKSLKDIVGFMRLKISNWEAVAPDSENTLLPKDYVDDKKSKYKRIVTLLDNDKAGRASAKKYAKEYELPTIVLDLGEKDLTDHLSKFGVQKVKQEVIKLLK